MNISNYLSTALLNHSLGVATYTRPSTVYAALYLSPPSAAGGGNEVSASDYVRVAMSWGAAAVGVIAINQDLRFPASGVTLSDWGTVTDMGIFDSPTNGNLLWFGPLSANIELSLGTDSVIPSGDLSISLS